MGDSLNSSRLSRGSEATSVTTAKKVSKTSLVASCPKAPSLNTFSHIALGSHGIFSRGAVGHAALFLLKVAALETLRRFSKAKCPFAWRGLQTLQMLCYPPFKWIQRWAPFKGLVEGMQVCFYKFMKGLIIIESPFTNNFTCNIQHTSSASYISWTDLHIKASQQRKIC